MNRNTIAVIGAGISGLSAAYALVKAGYNVEVFDSEKYPAMKTSYANGGQISVSNSEVWNSWGNIARAIKWIGKKDAPLLIRPSLDYDKILWILKFLLTTASGEPVRNTLKTIELGVRSRRLYDEIVRTEELQFDQSKCGILHFYKNQKYFDSAKMMQELYESGGCEWSILAAKEVIGIEPALSNSSDIIGGIWTGADWTGDIHKYCNELARVLQTKYNVTFHFDTHADKHDIELMRLNYGAVVIANGVDALKTTKELGDKQLVYPVKGYSVTITPDNPDEIPLVSLLDDQAKIVSSNLNGRFRIAGTAELTGYNYDIRRDRVDPLLEWCHSNFPNLDTRNYSQWACLRPMTPNMMPIVKRSKVDKVFYHFGHGHLGWTISPATAETLVNLIKKEQI